MTTQSGAFRGAGIGGGVISQQEHTLPSVFDIWAQQSLADSVKPAFKHVVKFMGLWYPKETKSVNKWFDELYLGFSLFLDTYYLKNYGGSFSENFYGMKRINPKTSQIPMGGDRLKSLFFISVWPYLRGKLDELQAKLSEVAEERRTSIPKFFLKYYPYFKTLLAAAAIIFQIAYIFNYSTIPTPFLWLSNSKLIKLTPEDLLQFESIPLHLQNGGLLTKLWRFIISIPSVFGRLFAYGLFFVQFLEFFYASDAAKELSSAHQRSQPPIHPVMKLSEPEVLTMEVDKCPLCFRRRVNDTVLSVSGYVFCYSCIDAYIRREGLCPITYLPATTNELIRLYKNNNTV
uniref:Peroxisome assembly protein 12 n=1 Tax=Panagrolaimus sp. PS1159 TaxID=55785 RepID=A0AC35FI11_9BILA